MPTEMSTAGTDQDLCQKVEALNRELSEAYRREAATAEVLRIVSISPTDPQPVFDAIAQSALRVCDGLLSSVYRYDGKLIDCVAQHNWTPEGLTALRRVYPRPPSRETQVATAILERRVVHVPDFDAPGVPQQSLTLARALGYRSILVVPILGDGNPVGAITVARAGTGPFSDQQISLLKTFADQAVIAIENTRLFEAEQASKRELQESLEYQTATTDVLQVISSSPGELQPVFDSILAKATRVCGANFGNLFLCEGEAFRHVAMFGAPPEFAELRRRNPVVRSAPNSILDRLTTTKQPQHIRDFREEQSFLDRVPASVQLVEIAGARTVLGVPLVSANKVIGILAIYRRHVEPFTDKQIDLVENFADQAVIALENARLLNELRESLQQQTATADVLKVISRSTFDLQAVLNALVKSAAKLCEADGVGIVRPETSRYDYAASIGYSAKFVEHMTKVPISGGRGSIVGRFLSEGRIVHIPDAKNDPEYTQTEAQKIEGYRTMLGVPLLREGTPIGIIVATRNAVRLFSDKQIELLSTFADQAVIAIENTRLLEELQSRTGELARSVKELQAIGEVGRAVNSTLDLKVVLKTIVDRAVQLSGADASSILYYRKELGGFELGETTGLDEDVIARLRKLEISANESGLSEAITNRQPLQVPDLIQRRSEPLRDAVVAAGFRSSLLVPLLGADDLLGMLILRRRQPGEFPQAVVTLMQAFADQSAIALENARLFEEIARKSRELEIAGQHKSQFVANMSHELRTPLAAMLGYAELLHEGIYGTLPEKSLPILTRIRSNGKHLLGLINTVLDIAKIEAGQFNLNLGEYALDSVVETVRAATEALAETKKLIFKTEVARSLPIGLGDEQRLTQVLLNLVGNAIKFTDTGEVRIAATAVNGQFAVSVADTGPGIPQEHQARIFEQFHQVDSSNTKAKGGTGLGLAIAKQIVELHGGRIWVDSTVGQGSTFRMELPVRVVAASGAA